MKKLVSIIVPVFNVEKYLRQCLDSIFGQTFNQFEVIIVNDGSTDNSGAICQEYEARDNRIVYLEKENGGVSEARNLGLDFATSEYIIFIDSDDWIEPTYVEVLYEKIEEEHIERAYKESEIEEILQELNLNIINKFDGYLNNNVQANSERIVYIVKKK